MSVGALQSEGYAQSVATAQRRIILFSFVWYPTVLALSGVAHLAVSWHLDEPLDIGTGLLVLGSGLALVLWLLTLGKRFAKKPPEPARHLHRVDLSIRTARLRIAVACVGGALLAINTVVQLGWQSSGFPRDVIPLSALFATYLFGVAYGHAYARRHLLGARGAHHDITTLFRAGPDR